MTPEEVAEAVAALAAVLEAIDAGEQVATSGERAFIAGALHALRAVWAVSSSVDSRTLDC